MSEPRVDLSSKLTQLSSLVDAYAEEGANKTEIQERINTLSHDVIKSVNRELRGETLDKKIELLTKENVGPLVTKIKDFYNNLQVFPKTSQALQLLESNIITATRMKNLYAQAEPGVAPEHSPANLIPYPPGGAPAEQVRPEQLAANANRVAAKAPEMSRLFKIAVVLWAIVCPPVALALLIGVLITLVDKLNEKLNKE